jgi:beta-glucosidase
VKVGASSADIKLQQNVTLKGKTVVKPLRDHYFSEVN